MKTYKTGCLICGQPIEYFQKEKKVKCSLCKEVYLDKAICKKGHYICNQCHSADSFEIIEKMSLGYNGTNPFQLAIEIMKTPQIKMHGPEHHFLVPAVLISAYHNSKKSKASEKKKDIQTARTRAKTIPGGICGFYGNCGAGVGTGIFISVITKSAPLSEEAWQLSNLMTSISLNSIAKNGGPRCCKRDSLLAIKEAVPFANDRLGSAMVDGSNNYRCLFSKMNKECRGVKCIFNKHG